MAKKLLIRTPQTTNGIDLAYDDKKQPIYKETIVELTAKKHFESINNSLPDTLRHEIETVEVDEHGEQVKPAKNAGK